MYCQVCGPPGDRADGAGFVLRGLPGEEVPAAARGWGSGAGPRRRRPQKRMLLLELVVHYNFHLTHCRGTIKGEPLPSVFSGFG